MNDSLAINERSDAMNRHQTLFAFLIAVLSVALFVFGHVKGSNMLLYAGTLQMAVSFCFFSDELLCLELLYIPLAGILKFSPDGAALFSYISLVGVAVFLMKRKFPNMFGMQILRVNAG